MTSTLSRYEAMRTDRANWTLAVVYYCADDPRLIVRNLAPFGWTWNFAHAFVWPGIALAITIFLGPVFLAASLGVKSIAVLGAILALSLGLLMFGASRLARDPRD